MCAITQSALEDISSVESQKGIIIIQQCSFENQKGAITVWSLSFWFEQR